MKISKKIGIVLKGYPRLSETFISQEILSLQKLGFDFHIISLRHPTDKAIHPVNREITAPVTYLPEYIHNDPFRVLKAWWNVRKFSGYARAWQYFRRDIVRDFSRNRFRRFAQGMVIASEFNSHISAYYSHFLHTPTSAARYASIITGKPFAISAHAKDIWTSPNWEIAEKLEDCRWLVTCTAGARDHLQKLSASPDKIHLIYHGLDLIRFPAPSKPISMRRGDDAQDSLRIITVGRAVAKKGLDNLLHALALLPENMHWQWTHIGGGELNEQLIRQSRELGISDNCNFCGALDQIKVVAAYNDSDLFVLPCRIDKNGDRDGLPNVIVEAQSQGLAVISTPISGIPELIEHDENGLLVEPDNPKLLATAIARLAADPELRNKMGSKGEEKVRTGFDHLSTVTDLAELLKEMLDENQEIKLQLQTGGQQTP
ncbi:MAG: glycosyltransferase family 4 protein [Hyphomicrobiales bacterium]|nr:glycosyltransferase family 4 protein [Hyphomicrobiales bacterium]